MDWQAIGLTVRLAVLVCVTLLVIGLPIAYWLAFSRWRWKFLVEAVVALPLVLPPTVLGFYVLMTIGLRSPIGRAWERWTGHGLAFTFEGLVLASILYSLPFMVQPIASAFAQVDASLVEASSLLGGSRWRTCVRSIVPVSIDGVITGIVRSVAHTLGVEHTDHPIPVGPNGMGAIPDFVIEENMVLNFDMPYQEWGWGSMHFEDTLLINKGGFEPLTSMKTELRIL